MTSAFPLDFNMASLSFYVQLIFEVSGDRKHEFYRIIHRPCHEIIKMQPLFRLSC